MYAVHPDPALFEAFRHKPYQGVEPDRARFLFVGLDANYDEGLAGTSIHQAVLDYHRDAVGFWRKHGVHHPFLLPGYSGGGRKYHRNFAQIGFGPEDAEHVSFVELLHVPTVGRNALTASDLDLGHLKFVRDAIFSEQRKWVFVCASVLRLMCASRMFPELERVAVGSGCLPEIYRDDQRTVCRHLHFSVYGKFEARRLEEARAIAALRNAVAV